MILREFVKLYKMKKKIFELPAWIKEETVEYNNHHIHALCRICSKKIRKCSWANHEKMCSPMHKWKRFDKIIKIWK
jgi:hypothetical protein